MATEAREPFFLATWQRMRAHNEWHLVVDDDAFFARTTAIAAALDTSGMMGDALARTVLTRAYGEILYAGLIARQERAASELWLAFRRLALRRGLGVDVAEELAQEAMTRVLEQLPRLRAPQSLIFWAFKVFYTVARDHVATATHIPSTDPVDQTVLEVSDPHDSAAEVEQTLAESDLVAFVLSKLSNDLEQQVMQRLLTEGDNPRDVARDLGLPLHRARIAKARALKRLRADPEILQRVRELTDDPNLQFEKGASDDETES